MNFHKIIDQPLENYDAQLGDNLNQIDQNKGLSSKTIVDDENIDVDGLSCHQAIYSNTKVLTKDFSNKNSFVG